MIVITSPLWIWPGENGSWHFITVPEDRTLAAGADGTTPLPDLTPEVAATDNVGVALNGITQSPPAGTSLTLGLHDVVMTVIDDAGNAAHATVHITVTDQSKPVVHAPEAGFTPVTVATDSRPS